MHLYNDRKQYYNFTAIILLYKLATIAMSADIDPYVPTYINDNSSNNGSFSSSSSSNTKQIESRSLPITLASSQFRASVSVPSDAMFNLSNSSPGRNKSDTNFDNISLSSSSELLHHNILELAQTFEQHLKSIRNTELGIPFIQEMLDSMTFTSIVPNDTKIVGHMAERLAGKLSRAAKIIKEMKRLVLNTIQKSIALSSLQEKFLLKTIIQPCSRDEFGSLDKHYDKKQIEILNYLHNVSTFNAYDDVNYKVNQQIIEATRMINTSGVNFKQLYFLSKDDFATNYNCNPYGDNFLLRRLFTSAIKNKQILILIDHGSSLNTEQLELTKQFANSIIDVLNENDFISLVAISDEPTIYTFYDQDMKPDLTEDDASKENSEPHQYIPSYKMYPASMDNKQHFRKFIDQLNRTKNNTNHTLGFQYAFRLLKKILSTKSAKSFSSSVPVFILYISRGLVSPLTEAKNVLEAIANGQKNLTFPVIINTCAIVLDEKRVMYEKQFLKDIAKQNYSKYNIDTSEWIKKDNYNLTGSMFVINRKYPHETAKQSAAVFEHWFRKPFLESKTVVHLPLIDMENDIIIPMTQSCEEFGIIGINLYMIDIVEDVLYYEKNKNSYAFIIDMNGKTIMHPSYPRPSFMKSNQFPTHISHLEQSTQFHWILNKMFNELKGNVTIDRSLKNEKIKYTWQRAYHFYIVCVATIINTNKKSGIKLNRIAAPVLLDHYDQENLVQINDHFTVPELVYHRLDLIPPHQPTCKHFRQIATMESGTLFLSASSFKSPFIYLKNNNKGNEKVCMDSAKSIMAYIKDTTNLLANPGLMPHIRNDVNVLFHMMAYLKKRHLNGGSLQKYIIRRYVATVNGVMQIYPGCMLNPNLDPIRRPWFQKAIENPGRIIMTEPYPDAGGAGYIVTIAHTVFEGKIKTIFPVAIVALDLTLGIIYKLLQQSAEYCSDSNIKCFLMEDKGYLLAHPSILEPAVAINNKNIRKPLEHITHKESYVANDILHHKTLVHKRICSNWFNRTDQRFYQFNISTEDVHTNIVYNEKTKYQIKLISGTNVFVGVLNSTGDGGAFCPCSTVDRICLNCNRMEQTYCECPCECPINVPSSSPANCEQFERESDEQLYCNQTEKISPNEICENLVQDYVTPAMGSTDYGPSTDFDLVSCINMNCEMYLTHNDCLGIVGCEWCQVDVDGDSLFTSPFCTQQTSCFNGILGSQTPYGDGDLGTSTLDSISQPAYSAIGPVTGAIIVLCIVIGFAMYCYRQNLESGTEQLYVESMPENNFGGMPLSRLDYDDIAPNDIGDLGNNYNAMNRNLFPVLNGNVPVSEISPYRVSSGGYRRPNGESDHGYSTMTPHEDSDNICFALAEPLINNKQRLSLSDSTSINTSVSSPTNQNNFMIDKQPPNYQKSPVHLIPPVKPKQIGLTVFPGDAPHYIQAPVTVHHPMETSS